MDLKSNIDELKKHMNNEQLIIWEIHQVNRQLCRLNEQFEQFVKWLKEDREQNSVEIQRGLRIGKEVIDNVRKATAKIDLDK